MQGGVYQIGSSFGMNSYYRPPQIVGTINCFSTRTSGVIAPSDAQRPSMQTSVVMGLVNNTQDLKHIDYDQNPKPISIQLYSESSVGPVASTKSLYTGGRRATEPFEFASTPIIQIIHTNALNFSEKFTCTSMSGNYNDGNIMNITMNSISPTSIQYTTNVLSPNITIDSSAIIIRFDFDTSLTGFYFSFNINGNTVNIRDENTYTYFKSPLINGSQKYYIYTYPINPLLTSLTISDINLSTNVFGAITWGMDTQVSLQYKVFYTPK